MAAPWPEILADIENEQEEGGEELKWMGEEKNPQKMPKPEPVE
jgi:hypothetical protein